MDHFARESDLPATVVGILFDWGEWVFDVYVTFNGMSWAESYSMGIGSTSI